MAKKVNPMPLEDDDVAADDTTNTTTSDQPATPGDGAEIPPARQGDQHRPYCRKHNTLMVAYSSRDGVTRYRCPVPNCEAKEKRSQPTSRIPREPMRCSHCDQRAREAKIENEPSYLELDEHRSTYAMLLMICPDPACRFSVRVPRPDIAARSRIARSRADTIGER